jgi:hypothetical protein
VDKILTNQEFRDGLKLADMSRSHGWPIFVAFCEDFIKDQKDNVYNEQENQLRANVFRGKGYGVSELLDSLKDRITTALAQEQAEANSAENKE